MRIETERFEWTDEDTELFKCYEDQWYNECLEEGIPEARAIEVGNRYNEQRESGLVAPKVVLDRYHLAIWRQFYRNRA